MSDIEKRLAGGLAITGVPTGFPDFDKMSAGLQPGALYIVAAASRNGKDGLRAQHRSVRRGRGERPVLIFSLEMSAEQIAQRMLSAEAKVNLIELFESRRQQSEQVGEPQARRPQKIEKSPIFIDDSSPLNTLELRGRCRRFFAKHGEGRGLIIIDYLQLMMAARRMENRTQEVSEISRTLKSIAREFKVPVIALSQLSRDVEKRRENNKRPMLSDLRESGSIEQDADMVLFLYAKPTTRRRTTRRTRPPRSSSRRTETARPARSTSYSSASLRIRKRLRRVDCSGAPFLKMKAFAKNGAKNDESLGGGFGLLNGGAPRALAPLWIFYPLVFISLALPNLIYSGADWFDTLHIMKWAWTMVPVALVSLIGGSMLALFGAERTGFRLDLFGAVWLGLLAFVSLQPFWCDIFAWSTYFKEWFFLGVAARRLYFLLQPLRLAGGAAPRPLAREPQRRSERRLRPIRISIELLIRDMNDICPLIMNVPGNYIGNTGQQEMFGLWMAMAAMNGIYLHMVYSSPLCGCAQRRLPMWANLFLLAFNSWGLWNSTTRAGMLALFTGTAALALTARSCREDGRALARRIGAAFALVVFMLAVNVCTAYFGWSRAYALINKTGDMLLNTSNIGARREIWITSWNVFKLHPLAGTGLGHYKWHYLEGQREAFKTHPELKWQFTYWAHSEYLQLLAELGISARRRFSRRGRGGSGASRAR